MLNKDLIFSLMMEDYMGNLYIPWLSTDFSEKEETTSLDFTLERSATMALTESNGRASSIELTFPEIKSGWGHKYHVVSFLSYQLNNMVCINNEIKFKKRA